MINLQVSDQDLKGNKFNGHDLHLYLNRRGHASTQVVINKLSADDTTIDIARDPDINRFTLSVLRTPILLGADIVHLHLIHNMPFDVRYLPILTKIKPVVITLHDPYFIGSHCIHHFDCQKWKTFCHHCIYPKKPTGNFPVEDSLAFEIKRMSVQASSISAIVASRWMEDLIRKSPIWSGKPIYRVPFGIDQHVFHELSSLEHRKKLGLSSQQTVLMFRQDPNIYKGLDIIISTLQNITPAKDTVLLTVGQRGHLKALKGKYSLLEFDWIKDDHKLADLYRACDLFLMPSRQEAFGMMAIEAMSCGRPVLALDGTALSEVIDAPRCGVAVKESEYARELQRLLDHPEELRDRGSRSLDFARREYNSEVYVDRILDVYREVMERHKLDDLARHMLEELVESSAKQERSNLSAEEPGRHSGSGIGRKVLRGLKKRIPRSWKQAIKRLLGR